jgi:hypothetical protein
MKLSSMKRILKPLLAVAISLTFATAATAQTASATQANEDNTKIRALFRQGAALLTEGKYEDARQTLLKAWQIRPTPDVGAVLGQAELATQHYRDAAEHLGWSLRNFPPVSSEKTLQATQALFADAKNRVGRILFKVDKAGAELRVDEKTVGSSPLDTYIFVEPGAHIVSVGGAETHNQQTITAQAGQEYPLTFTVRDSAPTPASNTTGTASTSALPQSTTPQGPPQSISAHADMSPVYWSLAIGGGLTAGSLVAALLFHGHASSKEDDAKTVKGNAGNCLGVTSANCTQLAALLDDRNTANSRAQVALVGTAVFAVATGVVTYLVWPTSSEQSQKPQPVAWATPNAAGLGLSGAF